MPKRDFTDFICRINRIDQMAKLFHIRNWPNPIDTSRKKTPKSLLYDGNQYALKKGFAFHLHGWSPWLKFDKRHPFKSSYEYLRKKKIGFLLFPEANDAAHNPIQPLQFPKKMTDNQRITPLMIKSVIENQKYRRYVNSIKFGLTTKIRTRWKLLLIGAVIIIVIMLYLSGIIGGR